MIRIPFAMVVMSLRCSRIDHRAVHSARHPASPSFSDAESRGLGELPKLWETLFRGPLESKEVGQTAERTAVLQEVVL
jgi:hypothetical protein